MPTTEDGCAQRTLTMVRCSSRRSTPSSPMTRELSYVYHSLMLSVLLVLGVNNFTCCFTVNLVSVIYNPWPHKKWWSPREIRHDARHKTTVFCCLLSHTHGVSFRTQPPFGVHPSIVIAHTRVPCILHSPQLVHISRSRWSFSYQTVNAFDFRAQVYFVQYVREAQKNPSKLGHLIRVVMWKEERGNTNEVQNESALELIRLHASIYSLLSFHPSLSPSRSTSRHVARESRRVACLLLSMPSSLLLYVGAFCQAGLLCR